MKNRKVYLTIYLFMAGMMLFGFLTLIVIQWESSNQPIDGFSKQYQDITIKETYDSEITAEQFISKLFGKNKQIRFQKVSDKGYSLIYLSGTTLPVELVEGRNFETEDFSEHRNVVLVDTEMKAHTYVVDEKRYLAIDGREYEVVGIFKKENNDIHPNTTTFVNMMAEQMQEQMTLSGRYLVEGVTYDEFQQVAHVSRNKNVYEIEQGLRWMMIQDALIFPIRVIGIGCIFCLAGFLYMAFMWLNAMNEIMDVSILCGATDKKVCIEIMSKFGGILCLAWTIPVFVFLVITCAWISVGIVIALLALHMCMFLGELVVVRKLHEKR